VLASLAHVKPTPVHTSSQKRPYSRVGVALKISALPMSGRGVTIAESPKYAGIVVDIT
jgi:hypothetical protein